MPTYEYHCRSCDTNFEWVGRYSDRSAKQPACPNCKGKKVERVYSTFFAKTSRKS